MRLLASLIFSLIFAALLVTACGQTGPLQFPKPATSTGSGQPTKQDSSAGSVSQPAKQVESTSPTMPPPPTSISPPPTVPAN